MATEPLGGPDPLPAPSVAGAAAVPDVDEVEGASEPQAAVRVARINAKARMCRGQPLVIRRSIGHANVSPLAEYIKHVL